MGVLTMGKLTRMTEDELLKVRGVGPKVLAGIKQNLADLGLSLRSPSPPPPPPPAEPTVTVLDGGCRLIRPTAWSR